MGKRQSDPQAALVKRLQDELTEACKQKAVDRMLQVFKEWEAAQVTLPKSSYAQALSVLAESDGNAEHGAPCLEQHFRHAKQIFERARLEIRDWSNVGESIYTLMVRLASRASGPLAAMEYLQQMRQPPVSLKPKLRTFIPILEACARGGLSDEAEALYRGELLDCCRPTEDTPIWTTDMEDRLWQSVFALRLRALAASSAQRRPEDVRERTESILCDLRDVCPQLRRDTGLVESLREAFAALGWQTEVAKIGADAICPTTGASLRAAHCTREELCSLANLIERLAIEQASPRMLDEWGDFKAWLSRAGHAWDMVIDGANVGHHNQNCAQGAFSHAQIREVINQCSQAGRHRIAVVLRERWLDPETDFALPVTKRKRRKLPPLNVVKPAREAPEESLLGLCGAAAAAAPAPAAPAAPPGSSPMDTDAAGGSPPGAAQPDSGAADSASAQVDPSDPRGLAALAEDWRRRGILVASPPSIDDDWVALYTAVVMCLRGTRDVQLVTNDIFRDHFFRMRQPPAFRTFCDRHLTRYHVTSERPDADGPPSEDNEVRIRSAQLFPPPLYSHCVQRGPTGCWHFPIRLPDPVVPVGTTGEEVKVDVGEPQWEWLVAWDPGAKKEVPGSPTRRTSMSPPRPLPASPKVPLRLPA